MVVRDVADSAREHHGAHRLLKLPIAPLASMAFGALGTFDSAENRPAGRSTGAVLGLDVVAFADTFATRAAGGHPSSRQLLTLPMPRLENISQLEASLRNRVRHPSG